MRRRQLAPVLVCAALLATGCTRRAPGSEANEVDARAALWLDEAGKGATWNPRVLEGQVTVVNFFATWCLPCLGQLMLLSEYQKELGPRGLQVVAIGMDLEGARVLDMFARAQGHPFPILIANEEVRQGETPFGRIPVVPVTFVLDRQGRIVRGWPGLADPGELRAAIERQL
ncbi:MAG: TlpA disulfide reductase family protein [Myxococcaceae bacterium]